jgi:hypothetical protein
VEKNALYDIRFTVKAGQIRPFARTITGLTEERVWDYAQTTLRCVLPALDATLGSIKVEMRIEKSSGLAATLRRFVGYLTGASS